MGCLGPHHGQIGMGEHRQSDMPVPARPTADFVLIQAALALGSFEAFFHRPALSRHHYHLRQGGVSGRIHAVVGALIRCPDLPAHPHPVSPAAITETNPTQPPILAAASRPPAGRPAPAASDVWAPASARSYR